MKPRWETFEVSESARFPELEGRRVTELAEEQGKRPLDVMCELALAEDLTTRFRAYIANDDADAVGQLLTTESVALGLSDAGAHVDQLCDAPIFTDLLEKWVREREVLSMEQAVHKMTGEPADMFGFAARGYLDSIRYVRPEDELVVVRMPAFGLSGPWRDRTGFAMTMEQVSGMAWLCGFPEHAPSVHSSSAFPSPFTAVLAFALGGSSVRALANVFTSTSPPSGSAGRPRSSVNSRSAS